LILVSRYLKKPPATSGISDVSLFTIYLFAVELLIFNFFADG